MQEFKIGDDTLKIQLQARITIGYNRVIGFGINRQDKPYIGVFQWVASSRRVGHGRIVSNDYYMCKYYRVCSKRECNDEYRRIRGYMPANAIYEAIERTLYVQEEFTMEQIMDMVERVGRYGK